MLLKFSKMQGLGNDFVVIDAINQQPDLTPENIRLLADRHFGVGCDQVLLVENSSRENVDFKYRIFNADGSEVEQCGNGARCFARFVKEKQLTCSNRIRVETAGGDIILSIDKDDLVTVNMGIPSFAPLSLPFLPAASDNTEKNCYRLGVEGKNIEFSAVSVGNPHITIKVADIDGYPVENTGKILESHSSFPQRVNVGFMQIVRRDLIRLRVYERGAGETLACGTGACAAVANGISRGWLDHEVEVILPGGRLRIIWQPDNNPLWMTGPGNFVYEGQIRL